MAPGTSVSRSQTAAPRAYLPTALDPEGRREGAARGPSPAPAPGPAGHHGQVWSGSQTAMFSALTLVPACACVHERVCARGDRQPDSPRRMRTGPQTRKQTQPPGKSALWPGSPLPPPSLLTRVTQDEEDNNPGPSRLAGCGWTARGVRPTSLSSTPGKEVGCSPASGSLQTSILGAFLAVQGVPRPGSFRKSPQPRREARASLPAEPARRR